MKKLLIIFFAFFIMMEGCGGVEPDGSENNKPVVPEEVLDFNVESLGLTGEYNKIIGAQQDFSVDFFKSVAGWDTHRNVVVSPFSIMSDLAMLSCAATGATHDELVKGLGFADFSQEMIARYFSTVYAKVKSDTAVVYNSANALWVNSSLATVKQTFADDEKLGFNVDIKYVDFVKDPVINITNDWISENTAGLIGRALDAGPEGSSLAFLTNALLFEGKWDIAYDGNLQSHFTNINGAVADRDFFIGPILSGYNIKGDNHDDPAVIDLRYKSVVGNAMHMFVILPPKNVKLPDFIQSFSAFKWRELYSKLNIVDEENAQEAFLLPKFYNTYDLPSNVCIDALRGNGISLIFGDGAEFAKMTDMRMPVSKISQKAILQVDKSGSKAAPDTAADKDISDMYVLDKRMKSYIEVNRPFLYMITDSYGSIFFMGTIVR